MSDRELNSLGGAIGMFLHAFLSGKPGKS